MPSVLLRVGRKAICRQDTVRAAVYALPGFSPSSARPLCVRSPVAGLLETAPLLRMKAGNTKPGSGLRIAAGNPFGSVRDGCDLYTFKSDGARDSIVRIPDCVKPHESCFVRIGC